MDPHFGDLRNVVAGIENQQAGHARGRPKSLRPMAPPLYLPESHGFMPRYSASTSNTVVAFAAADHRSSIYLSIYFPPSANSRPLEGFYTGLFIVSPALMTGVERCNIDLVIFLPRRGRARPAPRFPPPPVRLDSSHRDPEDPSHRRAPRLPRPAVEKNHPVGSPAILGLFVRLYTLQSPGVSWSSAHSRLTIPLSVLGSDVWGTWLALAGVAAGPIGHATTLIIGTLLLFALGSAAVSKAPRLAPDPLWEWEIYSFRLGAGLLLALFALGSNNDYGLMFLLFCLPLLFRLRSMTGSIRHWASAALLLSLIYVNWDFFSDEFTVRHMLLKQPIGWAIMGSLIGLLGATWSWPISWGSKK